MLLCGPTLPVNLCRMSLCTLRTSSTGIVHTFNFICAPNTHTFDTENPRKPKARALPPQCVAMLANTRTFTMTHKCLDEAATRPRTSQVAAAFDGMVPLRPTHLASAPLAAPGIGGQTPLGAHGIHPYVGPPAFHPLASLAVASPCDVAFHLVEGQLVALVAVGRPCLEAAHAAALGACCRWDSVAWRGAAAVCSPELLLQGTEPEAGA